jgi:hypothetical protein
VEYSEQRKSRKSSPLWLANTVHFVLGTISFILGVWVLLGSRDALQAVDVAPFGALGVGIAILLMLIGGLHITLSMSYWSFSFAPDDVAWLGSPRDGSSDAGRTASCKYVYPILDNGMSEAPGFPGAIAGALTAMLPMLVYAPLPVREHAYLQLLKAIHLVVLLIGFALAWAMTPEAMFPWVAMAFFVLATIAVKPQETFRLIREGRVDTEAGKPIAPPTLKATIALLVSVVLAPVLLSYLGKQGLAGAPFTASLFAVPALLILVPSTVGSALYFFALVRQAREFTSTDSRNLRQDTPTSDLSEGILDAAEAMIHGRFFRLERGHNVQADVVQGWLLAESQPSQVETNSAASLGEALREAWSSPMLRPLLALELLGLCLGVIGLVLLARLGLGAGSVTAGLSAAGLISAAQFCLLSAHRLWRRADFRSTVYRFKYKSTFQRVAREAGNTVTGHGKITDSAVRALSGHISCSVVQVSSVCFARGAPRYITSIDLDNDQTQRMLEALCSHDASIQQRLLAQDAAEGARLKLIASGHSAALPPSSPALLDVGSTTQAPD